MFTHKIYYKQPAKDTTAPIDVILMDNGGVEEVRILRAAGPAEPVGQVGQLPYQFL